MTTEKALREALQDCMEYLDFIPDYEAVRLARRAEAALALPETQGEPVAWLYTLEYGKAVANKMVSIEKLNYPFGVCGSDYLARNNEGISYVRQTPLYAAPPSQSQPVEWRDHVEQRLHSWRQRVMNTSGDRLALDDFMEKASVDDLIDYVCDEYAAPPSQPAQGWKLVPVEPTQAMMEAAAPFPEHLRAEHPNPDDPWHEGMFIATKCDQLAARTTYRAMLAAVPAAPTQAKPTNGEGA